MAINNKKLPNFPKLNKPNFLNEALKWHRFGLTVIPIRSGEKRPVTVWSEWDGEHQTEEHITAHWTEYSEHEVGAITDNSFIVLDADTPEAIKSIESLEKAHDIVCDLVVSTSRGEHHYYKLATDTYVKQDSHDTKKFPNRIDVRTGHSLIILPPSGPRKIKVCNVDHLDQLQAVNQDFIDVVAIHNGRDVPRPHIKQESTAEVTHISNHTQAEIRAYLDHIDPDGGYEDWRNVGMALHHEFEGNDIGLDIFDEWSSKGDKYTSQSDLDKKWQSFANYSGTAITIGTLLKMAIEGGADVQDIQDKHGFERCETETVHPTSTPTVTQSVKSITPMKHPLLRFSLRGKSGEYERQMQEDKFILGELALLHQWTLIYAQPGTGKTLLVMMLLISAIESGEIDPTHVFYVNADDNQKGLTQKMRLADKYGFHMIAPGHNSFKVSELPSFLKEISDGEHAQETVVFLDTSKKVYDPMSKKASREYGIIIRNFISKGSTVIVLAHTNKNLGSDGKPIYAGTSDSLDDTDCAYTLRVIDTDSSSETKTVEFENIKNRGSVVSRAAYQYSTLQGLSYEELIDSVEQVENQTAELLQDDQLKQDLAIIEAIKEHITSGTNKKLELISATATSTGSSKRSIQKLIEDRTGDDILVHDWNFNRVERGAQVFFLLEPPIETDDSPKPENLES
jgi:primase-like protein/bifunctional DNA primase/polymerase-like protein/AAA domain-containing protein